MSIRPEADRIHFAAHPTERIYASALDEGFDVTFAGEHQQLSYWVADPKEAIRRRFGLLQEVLVIFYDYPTVDARALSAINELSVDKKLRQRIDKFIYLVVHTASGSSIPDLLKQVSDKVIVPISATELRDPQRGSFFIRKTIADAIGGLDLFEMSFPVTTDKEFFGREELVQHLTARSLGKNESSGVFGLRKTGKTSVLYALERRVQDKPVIPLYIDCQTQVFTRCVGGSFSPR